jgi:PAS domain S-box-containing protein
MEFLKYKSQLFAAREQLTVYLRQAQNGFARLGGSVKGGLREALRASQNDLQDLMANSHDAMVVMSGKIAKCRSQFFAESQRLAAHLRQAQNMLGRLARSVVARPKRLQKALRARENNLRKLLAGSPDAIVMMDVDRRFVAANLIALDLFGVSATNMKKFTIDAFLSRNETLHFNGNGSPFKGREERHGECEIRRLDGGLRVAEYIFVAHFVPYRHLCRFRNVKAPQIKFIEFNSGHHGNGSNIFQLQ